MAQPQAESPAAPSEDPNSSKKKEEDDAGELASLGQLFQYATPVDFFIMVVAAISSGCVGAAQPGIMILFADIMDLAGFGEPGQALLDSFETVTIKMVVLGCICGVCAWIGDSCFRLSGLRQSGYWRKKYLSAVIRQDIGWYDTNSPSELSTRIAESTQLLEEGISDKLNLLFRFLFQGLVGIGVSFWYSWDMTLVLMALSPLVGFGTWFMTKATGEAEGLRAGAYAKAGGVASETLSELRTVAALGAEQKQAQRYVDNLEDAKKAGVRSAARIGFANGLMFSSGNFMAAVGFIYGSFKIAAELDRTKYTDPVSGLEFNCANAPATAPHLIEAGLVEECRFSGGDVIIALFALQMGAQGLGLVQPSIAALAKARKAAHEILKVVERKLVIDPFSDEGLKPARETCQGRIDFENVFFTYPSRPEQPIARGYNFTVEPGTTVALVGQSGSGKSTAIQLIERFYDPDAGVVKLDGTDLKQLNVRWLRQNVGLVGQEPVLFAGSIARNIGYGKEGATMQEIEQAAKMANAHTFIQTQFPQKYETDVGEKGGQLSGGQKQRVAIARAIIKNPVVLLLDEATSALDTESERIVQEALDQLLATQKRTTIVIAHRLTTIRNADKICVIEEGQIAEQGSHEQLMAKGEDGSYFKLVNATNKQPTESPLAGARNDGVVISSDPTTGGSAVQRVPSASRIASGGDPTRMASDPKLVGGAAPEDKEEEKKKKKEEEAKQKQNVKRIWALHTSADYPYFAAGTLGALLVGGANPAMGVIFVKCMFNFYGDDPGVVREDSYFWSGLMAAVSLLQVIGDTWRGWGFGLPGERLTIVLRKMYYDALVRQEIGWHDMPENTSGKNCANLATEINLMQALSGEAMGRNILSLCTVVVAFVLAFVFGDWAVTLVAVACIPIMISGMAIELMLMSGGSSAAKMGEEAGRIMGEVVTSVRTIASFTLESHFYTSFCQSLDAFNAKAKMKCVLMGVFPGYSQASLFWAFALLYWFGGKRLSEGKADFESMFIPIFCMFMLGAGIGQAANGATDAAKAGEAANRFFEVVDRKSKIDYSSGEGGTLSKVQGKIEFEGVVFSYPARPEQKVCDGYTLSIQPGTTVALVGQSGSGKSTAIQLVERFYDPDAGVVKLDGTDLRQLNISFLRKQIGLVGQEPVLFAGTIAENIGYGKEGATMQEIEQAAKMANAHSFIQTLGSGYDTYVGEKGGQLSGGQKQRVAIARAIIKNPVVLLLDEATSALDTESERIVQEALDQLLATQKRTTIVIAHRLTTIRNADKICVIEKGKVVEQGTHDELIAIGEGGKYHLLAGTQNNSH